MMLTVLKMFRKRVRLIKLSAQMIVKLCVNILKYLRQFLYMCLYSPHILAEYWTKKRQKYMKCSRPTWLKNKHSHLPHFKQLNFSFLLSWHGVHVLSFVKNLKNLAQGLSYCFGAGSYIRGRESNLDETFQTARKTTEWNWKLREFGTKSFVHVWIQILFMNFEPSILRLKTFNKCGGVQLKRQLSTSKSRHYCNPINPSSIRVVC